MNLNLTDQVFELVNLFREEEEKGNILRKSFKLSEQAREEGNKLYRQKKHDRDIHKNILLQYTKSIAFAPADSEQLALGFSNRSVLLMHLHYYDKCMLDIDHALEITKSDQLKSKLESRKQKCMMLMNKATSKSSLKDSIQNMKLNEDEPNSIDITPSKILQAAADSVSLKYNKTFGRYLIANRDIKPGEIVIAERGYACYPKYQRIYLGCSHCLSFAWNAIPCDHCVFAVYCNETCKKEAWKDYHDVECPLLKFLHYDKNIYTVDVLLASRMFIKAVKAEGLDSVMNETQLVNNSECTSRLLSNGVLDSNKFRSSYNLHTRPNYRQNETNGYLYELIIIYLLIKRTSIIHIDENAYNADDEKMIMQLKMVFIKLRDIIDMNGFSYHWHRCDCKNIENCQKNCDSITGSLVAPCASLMNHSCISNVGKFFIKEGKIVFYASMPIKKGEQLYGSYGPNILNDPAIRREFIMQNFHFECACEACNEKKSITGYFEKDMFGKILITLVSEFQKKYSLTSPFMSQDPMYWTVFNKELLEQVLTITEIIHSHYDRYTAFGFLITYYNYTMKAFMKLFGEKCVIPNDC